MWFVFFVIFLFDFCCCLVSSRISSKEESESFVKSNKKD